MGSEVQELKAEVQKLAKQLQKVTDEADIRKTHFKYGYYLDKCLYNQVVDMFSNSPDAYVEFLGSRYRGKEGIKRLYQGRFQKYFVAGRNGPVHGFLLDHVMMQDIIDVDEDGTHAWGRLRTIMSAGTHQTIQDEHPRGHAQWWEGGVYENEYIKEDGVWKLFHYRYFPFWHADVEKGWAHTRRNYVPWPTKTYPEDPSGPDELIEQKMLWPETAVIPFHYPHPVTGEHVAEDDLRAPHYGQPASTAPPALTLALPKDMQERKNGEASKGQSNGGIGEASKDKSSGGVGEGASQALESVKELVSGQ